MKRKWVLAVLLCLPLLNAEAQEKPLVAVLPFAAVGVSEADAHGLTVLFETALQNTEAFVVIEQTRAGAILGAQERSLDECVDELCAVEIGKLLSANQIVMGTVGRISTVVYLNLKLIDVATGKNLRAAKTQGDDIKAMIASLDDLASEVADVEYIETIVFDNGEYTGETKNGEPHGQGTYLFAAGDRYDGEWKDGEKNGQGTFDYASGDRYEGEFRNDKFHGEGTYYSFSGEFAGDRYEGEWQDGKQHGQGTYYFFSGEFAGDRYEGEWQDGKQHGRGTYHHANGNRYEGEFEDGAYLETRTQPGRDPGVAGTESVRGCVA